MGGVSRTEKPQGLSELRGQQELWNANRHQSSHMFLLVLTIAIGDKPKTQGTTGIEASSESPCNGNGTGNCHQVPYTWVLSKINNSHGKRSLHRAGKTAVCVRKEQF